MKNKKEKSVEYYMNLPYKIEIIPDPDGGYVAEVKELKGCMTEADTWEELYKMIEDAKRCWLETAIEAGVEIPLPEIRKEKKCSNEIFLKKMTTQKEKELIHKSSPAELILYDFLHNFSLKDNRIRNIKPKTFYEKLLVTILKRENYFDEETIRFRIKQFTPNRIFEIIPYLEVTKDKEINETISIIDYYIMKKYYPEVKANYARYTMEEKIKPSLVDLAEKLINNQKIPKENLISAIKEADYIFEMIIIKDALKNLK